jgi:hypothetical protein
VCPQLSCPGLIKQWGLTKSVRSDGSGRKRQLLRPETKCNRDAERKRKENIFIEIEELLTKECDDMIEPQLRKAHIHINFNFHSDRQVPQRNIHAFDIYLYVARRLEMQINL